jgi:bifunctional DNA-binding transcriptional regulator/antitoxin component of YhaV-PrlF toxin-antitoxin module
MVQYPQEYFIWHAKDVNTLASIRNRMPDSHSASLLSSERTFRTTTSKEIVRENGWKDGDKLSEISEDDGIILEAESRNERVGSVAYSIGYEGKNLDEFLGSLMKNKVEQLIDVRKNAFSFKAGFSKTPLKDASKRTGIMYIHIPQLGTDQESRKEYKETGDIGRLLETFSKRLDENPDSFETLKSLINCRRSAIMCFEDDYTRCHRSIIENRLKEDGVSVVHLCNGKRNAFF